MSESAREVIQTVQRAHDDLIGLARELSVDQLKAQSACSDWSVAQVLSHLGSAAEIGRNTVTAGKADMDAAQPIWDRWNAMSPEKQAAGFVEAATKLSEVLASFDDTQLADYQIDVGFLPAPVDLSFYAKMRLSEVALHGWDIRVAFDPGATVHDWITLPILDQLPMFAGFFAQPTGAHGVVSFVASNPGGQYGLELRTDGASFSAGAPDAPTATIRLPSEALIRLTAGRLGPEHTPASVTVEGDVSLDDLRAVFPGY
jgi:uncharacterized protein (TIGR03083 family)